MYKYSRKTIYLLFTDITTFFLRMTVQSQQEVTYIEKTIFALFTAYI